MLDKKGRLFGVVSLVDLFAVVMLAAIVWVVVGVARGAEPRAVVTEEQALEIVFIGPEVCDFVVAALVAEGYVLNRHSGLTMGRVIAVEVGESVEFVRNAAGNEVARVKPGHSSVRVYARMPGRLSDGSLLLGGGMYSIGSDLQIWVGDAVFEVYVAEIREVQA